jgi:hypothetical protein
VVADTKIWRPCGLTCSARILTCQAAAKEMMPRLQGRIVTIGSVAAFKAARAAARAWHATIVRKQAAPVGAGQVQRLPSLHPLSVFPLYDAANVGMQRRRVHGVIADKNFNPRAIMDDDFVKFDKSTEAIGTVADSPAQIPRDSWKLRNRGFGGPDSRDRSLFPEARCGPSTQARRLAVRPNARFAPEASFTRIRLFDSK